MNTLKMDEVNNIVESQSASSCLFYISSENEKRHTGQQTKIITNTKSRLYRHCRRNNFDDKIFGEMKSIRNVSDEHESLEALSDFYILSDSKQKQTYCIQPQQHDGFGRKLTLHNSSIRKLELLLKSRTILRADKNESKEEFVRKLNTYYMLNTLKATFMINSGNVYNDSDFDLRAIKRCLENSSSAIKKFNELQSLILKLSNQDPAERRATVQAMVDIDIFNLKSGSTTTLKDILWPINIRTPHPLQTSAARLLNSIASYRIGRYYFNRISMVKLLTWNSTEVISDSMADNLLAAMKKLILHQFQLSDMLTNGLLEWLINHMEKDELSASAWQMECMSDMLRMLMDIEIAAECSYVDIPHLIYVLVRYLNVENEFVKVNVCHSLRALLRNEMAIEIGNKMNLQKIVEDQIKKASNSKLKTDLQLIRKLFLEYRKSNPKELMSSTVDLNTNNSTMENCKEYKKNVNRLESGNKLETISENTEKDLQELEENENIEHIESRSDVAKHIESNSAHGGGIILDKYAVKILFSNLDSALDQSSSFLSCGSQLAVCKIKAVETLKTKRSNVNKLIEMDDSSSKQQSNVSNDKSTEYSDLTSIAKDPNARNEILENDSFINELCEKIVKQLEKKNFCGANCNPNCQNEDGAKL